MKNIRKVTFIAAILMFALNLALAVSAGNEFNQDAPTNVKTDSLDSLVNLVFWAVRIIIGAAGGIPSIIKVVQGQTDENPRDRNAGITGIIAIGVGIGATFVVQNMF